MPTSARWQPQGPGCSVRRRTRGPEWCQEQFGHRVSAPLRPDSPHHMECHQARRPGAEQPATPPPRPCLVQRMRSGPKLALGDSRRRLRAYRSLRRDRYPDQQFRASNVEGGTCARPCRSLSGADLRRQRPTAVLGATACRAWIATPGSGMRSGSGMPVRRARPKLLARPSANLYMVDSLLGTAYKHYQQLSFRDRWSADAAQRPGGLFSTGRSTCRAAGPSREMEGPHVQTTDR
jgi:hypothetical protein